jgi:hypothetical protein
MGIVQRIIRGFRLHPVRDRANECRSIDLQRIASVRKSSEDGRDGRAQVGWGGRSVESFLDGLLLHATRRGGVSVRRRRAEDCGCKAGDGPYRAAIRTLMQNA